MYVPFRHQCVICTCAHHCMWFDSCFQNLQCRFLGEMRQRLHLYLHSKTKNETNMAVYSQAQFCLFSLLPAESRLWPLMRLHCSLSLSDFFFFLLCSDLPCLLCCLTILLRWPLNSFIITLFFVLLKPPSHTLPWEALFCLLLCCRCKWEICFLINNPILLIGFWMNRPRYAQISL